MFAHTQAAQIFARLAPLALISALLLAGCAQSPQNSGPAPDAKAPATELTESQRRLYQRALNAADREDYERATELLTQLSRQQPQHPGTWLNLAGAQYESGNTDQAREALEKAEALASDSALVENLKGSLALEAGDIEAAETYYKSALKHNGELAEAHYNLALLYDTYYQDIARAVEHYQAYLKLIPAEDKRTEQWVEQLKRSLSS